MKCTFIAIGIALALGASAQAKTPKEVLEPYKAYRAAVAANDGEAARKQAKLAWKAAEEHLGNSKTTGDLAQNYADVKAEDGILKAQLRAMERALELSSFYGEDADDMYLQRGVRLLEYYAAGREGSKGRKLAKKLLRFGEENGLERSVL